MTYEDVPRGKTTQKESDTRQKIKTKINLVGISVQHYCYNEGFFPLSLFYEEYERNADLFKHTDVRRLLFREKQK